MSAPRVLTVDLLEAFQDAHRAVGAPTPLRLVAGHSGRDGREWLADLGLSIPDELRTLWDWAPDLPRGSPGATKWISVFEPFSPMSSAEYTDENRELAAEVEIEVPSTWVHVFWCGQGESLALDTSRQTDGIAPVIYQDLVGETGVVRDAAASLGDLIAHWTHEITSGRTWYVDKGAGGYWDYSDADEPREFPLDPLN